MAFGNPVAAVTHAHGDAAGDLGRPADRDGDGGVGLGIFDGVVDQVLEDLGQFIGLAQDERQAIGFKPPKGG